MTEKKHDEPAEPKHKAVREHSLADAGIDLLHQIQETRHAVKDNVAELRQAYADFMSKLRGERLSPHDEAVFKGMMTELESELNKLDPDSPITD